MPIRQKHIIAIAAAIVLIGGAVWYVEDASTKALTAHHAVPAQPLSVSPTAGMAAEFQGDTEHAQQYLRRALALDPLFWQARVAIAEIDSAGFFRAAL